MSLVLCLKERRFTKPTTTDRLPTASHRPTDRSFTDLPTTYHWPPIHLQVLHRPTDPPTINQRPTNKCSTDPPTTGHRPTDRSYTDLLTAYHWSLTHQQVLHQPTDNRPPTNRQVFHWPIDYRPPTHRQVLHRSINHRLTDSSTILQLTINPLTRQSYFNKVSIGPILSTTNFKSSFGMGTIYYWIGKTIYKLIDKKERW